MSDANERAALRAIALRGPDAIKAAHIDMLQMMFSGLTTITEVLAKLATVGHSPDECKMAQRRCDELMSQCFDEGHYYEKTSDNVKKCRRCNETWTRNAR